MLKYAGVYVAVPNSVVLMSRVKRIQRLKARLFWRRSENGAEVQAKQFDTGTLW